MAKNLVLGPVLGQIWSPKIIFCGFYVDYMLEIVASYNCIQFQEKLMNQTWENGKKPSFKPDFGPFGPNLGPKTFFRGFHLYWMLYIAASYHCMQFQGKLMS